VLTDLDEADPRPYVRLAARLRRQILDGEVAPGQRVPSITALSQESGHARQTCGKAMQLLEREELLRFIPGLGYYATPPVRRHRTEPTTSGAGDLSVPRRLRRSCHTGKHDVVVLGVGGFESPRSPHLV
jgi:DNA-binding GntR family transcriptional regulator